MMRKIFLPIIAVVMIASVYTVKSSAESTIYFFQNFPYLSTWHYDVTFNGDTIELPLTESVNPDTKGIPKYPKAVIETNIKNDGRLIITKEYTWYKKPYHDEIIIDLVDGETYYIDFFSGFGKGFKVQDNKHGEKELQKARKNKGWMVFENENAVIYDN